MSKAWQNKFPKSHFAEEILTVLFWIVFKPFKESESSLLKSWNLSWKSSASVSLQSIFRAFLLQYLCVCALYYTKPERENKIGDEKQKTLRNSLLWDIARNGKKEIGMLAY